MDATWPEVRRPVVGLALGSGSARGWAHIGVLRALAEAGVVPDLICGTSIGALVGAVRAVDQLPRFEDWVLGLGRRSVFSFMDFHLGGGVIKGERLIEFWRSEFADVNVEAAPIPFAAVATDLHSGAEVWLRSGPMAQAVRASIALPGLFTPAAHAGRWLVDGGLVNPVPVSLARALGADVVIAVDLNADLMQRHWRAPHSPLSHPDSAMALSVPEEELGADSRGDWIQRVQAGWQGLNARRSAEEAANEAIDLKTANAAVSKPSRIRRARAPSLVDVVSASLNIMQVRITRSRMAGDPPEIVIAPRLAQLGLMDFHRAREAIDAGYLAAQATLPQLAYWGLQNSEPVKR